MVKNFLLINLYTIKYIEILILLDNIDNQISINVSFFLSNTCSRINSLVISRFYVLRLD